MTVLYPRAFASSAAAGFDGTFDWDFLIPAFAPTKIQPMDFDCVVERNHHFLCFETKDKGKPIPGGQVITLERLALSGNWTVIVLRAKTAEAIRDWDAWFRGRKTGRLVKRHYEGDAKALVAFVRRWFHAASSGEIAA